MDEDREEYDEWLVEVYGSFSGAQKARHLRLRQYRKASSQACESV